MKKRSPYRIRNWSEYNASLKHQGSGAIRVSSEATAKATLEIVSVVDSADDVSDAKAAPDSLQDAPVEIEQVSADGAYDQRGCHDTPEQTRREGTHPTAQRRKDLAPRKLKGRTPCARRSRRPCAIVSGRTGRPQDGFMQSHEVYNLKLNADLVALSERRTALGKDVKSVCKSLKE